MLLWIFIICCYIIQRSLEEVAQTPNVVKATNRPGLYDELEDIQKRLQYLISF